MERQGRWGNAQRTGGGRKGGVVKEEGIHNCTHFNRSGGVWKGDDTNKCRTRKALKKRGGTKGNLSRKKGVKAKSPLKKMQWEPATQVSRRAMSLEGFPSCETGVKGYVIY